MQKQVQNESKRIKYFIFALIIATLGVASYQFMKYQQDSIVILNRKVDVANLQKEDMKYELQSLQSKYKKLFNNSAELNSTLKKLDNILDTSKFNELTKDTLIKIIQQAQKEFESYKNDADPTLAKQAVEIEKLQTENDEYKRRLVETQTELKKTKKQLAEKDKKIQEISEEYSHKVEKIKEEYSSNEKLMQEKISQLEKEKKAVLDKFKSQTFRNFDELDVENTFLSVNDTIEFRFHNTNTTNVSNSDIDTRRLRNLVQIAHKGRKNVSVYIYGFASKNDADPTDASESRARSVAEFLKNEGIFINVKEAKGKGYVAKYTEEASNARVEIIFK